MTSTTALMLRVAGTALATLVVILPALWGAFALWYQLAKSTVVRAAGVILWGACNLAALIGTWRGHVALGVGASVASMAVLLTWWTRIKPSHHGDWADDVAEMTTGEVEDRRVTLHNVRNFDWRSTSDYTPRWETRHYDLDQLRSVDIVMSYWRGPAIAHMVISFGFDGGAYVAFSVEIRRRKTQQFSEIGGFFKEFELSIIATDEYDSIRLRSTVRGERVHIYRLLIPVEATRRLFLAYISEANRVAAQPHFYNTITVNCTTLVYQMMRRIVGHLPLSYRLLFSGYIPEYVYRAGGLDRRFSLEELRALGFLTDRAKQCSGRTAFSTDIRRGVPTGDPAGHPNAALRDRSTAFDRPRSSTS